MKKLHINSLSDNLFVPKQGQRDLMCSNKKSHRCPFLGINNSSITEDVALGYLAEILVDTFLDQKRYASNKFTESK
jgi:hypothetical protein